MLGPHPLRLSPLLALVALACNDASTATTSAFTLPIDFAFACEGDGATVAPENDETAADFTQTRMCPDLPSGDEGDGFGVVLDRQPPRLVVLQVNPASGTRRFIDADFFMPGVSGIPVGPAPLRVLTAPDSSAFYVVSAADARVDRVVLHGFDGTTLDWSSTTFALPAAPIGAEIIGNDLVIIPESASELWAFDLTSPTPEARPVAMPDAVSRLAALGDDWLVTFRSLPTLRIYDPDGTLLDEVGLVPACRNGLDDDQDGLIDRLDLDCLAPSDDDESPASGAERMESLTKPLLETYAGAAPCADGLDNDGDGATDAPADPDCADADDDGELYAECDNGRDDDGDGATDLADESCFLRANSSEHAVPVDGPFHPTFVDGGAYGRFVYVLDERAAEILVFSWDGDRLTRVDVNAADATPPALETLPYSDLEAEPETSLAVPAVRSPALARQGRRNIEITETSLAGLTSGRLRGETWDRLIPGLDGEPPAIPLDAASNLWRPGRCDATSTTTCLQPALDDATWFAFGPNVDGRIQLIEAIRRGTPVHRLAQRTTNLGQRAHDLTAPRLTLRGRLINARGEPALGLPFIGPALEEVLVKAIDRQSPERQRRFGIWPPADLETALSETWTLTYQGRLPSTSGVLGQLLADDEFVAPSMAFCEAGVAPGDWIQFTVSTTAVDPALVHTLEVALEDGRACPVNPIHTTTLEVEIAEVGMDRLTLRPETARIRPSLPTLDTEALEAQGLPRRACEQALGAIDDTLGRPDRLVPTPAFGTSNLPEALTFEVRGAAWIAVGTRSGFLHRQRWNRAEARCEVDETLSPLLAGRIAEVTDSVSKYTQCPPTADALREGVIDNLAPAASRYFNPSFGLDIFRGCERDATSGAISAVESQQDTAFTFTVTGPHQGSALTVPEPFVLARVPLLPFRRQQIQLDSAARRAAILQFRLGDPKVIATFQ
jgi:hypothetical protein